MTYNTNPGVFMQPMRLTAVLLMATLSMFAADLNTGTWKLNTAKTKYTTGQPPKDQTTTIEKDGDNYTVGMKGTLATGAPVVLRYTVPVKGGPGTIQESTVYDAVTSKRISDSVRDLKYIKAGDDRMSFHAVTSADGKSLTVTVKGTDPAGNPVDGVVFYDKQ